MWFMLSGMAKVGSTYTIGSLMPSVSILCAKLYLKYLYMHAFNMIPILDYPIC
jgi:phospholipid N-methyltransferase